MPDIVLAKSASRISADAWGTAPKSAAPTHRPKTAFLAFRAFQCISLSPLRMHPPPRGSSQVQRINRRRQARDATRASPARDKSAAPRILDGMFSHALILIRNAKHELLRLLVLQ